MRQKLASALAEHPIVHLNLLSKENFHQGSTLQHFLMVWKFQKTQREGPSRKTLLRHRSLSAKCSPEEENNCPQHFKISSPHTNRKKMKPDGYIYTNVHLRCTLRDHLHIDSLFSKNAEYLENINQNPSQVSSWNPQKPFKIKYKTLLQNCLAPDTRSLTV